LIPSLTDFFFFPATPTLAASVTTILALAREAFLLASTVIVYCVENDEVLILRVVHGRRDLEGLFGGTDL
jgi:plasmid stabilization system protein ParE